MRSPFPQPRNFPRAFALALLLVFVLAQTLGWVHRGLHGSGLPAHAPHPTQLAPQASTTHVDASGWTADLFGNHADASDCRLFDLVAKPGCLPQTVFLPAVPPSTAFLAATHAGFIVRWAALFDARGPPRTR